MFVYEYTLKLKCCNDIVLADASTAVGGFIDSVLAKTTDMLELHNKKQYKLYTYDLPFPLEKDRVYLSGKVYKVHLRTVNQELAEYFSENVLTLRNRNFIPVGGNLQIIPKNTIDRVYSLTPVIIKNDFGYWKSHLTKKEFEKRITDNLAKKYFYITGKKLDEDVELFTSIEFLNHKPVKTTYKGINLLGDKLQIIPASNPTAQEVFYMALGVGLGENNSRGLGFIGYRFCE